MAKMKRIEVRKRGDQWVPLFRKAERALMC